MKKPGFLEGVAFALIAAICGELLFEVLPWIVGRRLAVLLIVGVLSMGYLLYLLRRSPGKTGRATLFASWGVGSLAASALNIGIPLYLLLQLAFIWLTRSLYFRSGLFGALADLGLHALAFLAGVWALGHSGSVFMALWSFFLVEALFPLLPESRLEKAGCVKDEHLNPHFEQAHRTALTALQKLSAGTF